MVDEFGAELSVIGKPNRDYVAEDIVRGEHTFAEDVPKGGKLYGRILGAKYAHAKITNIDTSKAEALEGVKAVITYKDVAEWSDNVLCVDQAVAAVAAVDEDMAERALDLIEVTYNTLPPVIDPDEALKPGAPNAGVFPDGNITPTPLEIAYGDVAQGFTEADVTVEENVGYIARHTHNELEPFVTTAWWEGDDVYCWITSQSDFVHRIGLKFALSASLKTNVPLNKVHIYCHGTGGGFGNKYGNQTNLPAALLARKTGKPVTMKMPRRLYTVLGAHQYGVKARIKIGAKNDGTLTAVEMEFWNDGGRNGDRSTFCDVAQSTWKCANFKANHWGIATNKGDAGAWRCVQHPAGGFLSDIVLEKLAAKLKINPLEFRRKIFLTEPIFQATGRPLFSFGVRQCLDKAAEVIGYTAKYHEPGAMVLPDGRLHGIGIHARCDAHGGMYGTCGSIINMCADGTALFNSGCTRVMGGPGALGTIIAETLGVSYDAVRCGDWGNTDVAAEGGFQGGSTHTISSGAAAMEAAKDVRVQLFAVAASSATGMLNTTPDALDAKDNKIFLKADPTKFVTHAQVMAARGVGFFSGGPPIIGRGVKWDEILRKPVGNFAVGETGVHRTGCASAAEVAVDPDTGEVELLNYVNVVDAGRVIDKISSEGQLLSGMQCGWNQAAIFEDIYDPVTGVLVSFNHIHDRVATTMDIPVDKNQFVLLETIDANGPYGCHGIGEPATGTFSSINNAINNAINKWVVATPATARTILRALEEG